MAPKKLSDAEKAAELIKKDQPKRTSAPQPLPPMKRPPPPPPPPVTRPSAAPAPPPPGTRPSAAPAPPVKTNPNQRPTPRITVPTHIVKAGKPRFVPEVAKITKPTGKRQPRDSVGNVIGPGQKNQKSDDVVNEYIKCFRYLQWPLLIFGRWPLSFEKEEGDSGVPKYKWEKYSLRSIYFCVVSVLTVLAWIASVINVYEIFMVQHNTPLDRTDTQILEQALFERHTVFIMMMLLHQTLNVITAFLLYQRRVEYEELFTKSIQFTVRSKLRLVEDTYREVITLVAIFCVALVILIIMGLAIPCATTKGVPTVMSIMLLRWFLGGNYLTKSFPGTGLHIFLKLIGLVAILLIFIIAYLYLFVFLWLLRLYRNGWVGWNQRAHACVCRGDKMATVKARTTYDLLFDDHCNLQKLTRLLNYVYDFILEFYLFTFTFMICYEAHLAIKSTNDGDHKLTIFDAGIYFARPNDYIPACIFTILFLTYISLLMWACCWFEDDSMNGYNIMRRKVFMDGLVSDVQVFFCMSLLQAYNGPTKLRIEAGDYVNLDRSNILVMWSLVATMVLVLYQVDANYDMNTEFTVDMRKIIGEFLTPFESLPPDHWHIHNLTTGHRYKTKFIR